LGLLAPEVCSFIQGMTQEGGYGVLTDAQWEKLAPLIEACRPHHKTECLNLRRTIEAIIWRHTNGAKWRAIRRIWGHGGWRHKPSTDGAIMVSGSACLSWRNTAMASSWVWRSSTAPPSGLTRRPLVRPKRGLFSRARQA
jgi:hypothetical protein